MIKIKNILVATDFSEPSDSALEYGRALALNFGARLHVLTSSKSPSSLPAPTAPRSSSR